MWDFTYMCKPNNFPLSVSLCLSVGFKISLLAMNQSYSLSLAWWAFSFTSASSMGLHMSTPHIFYPSWEPRTSPLSSTISNNTPLLDLFQDCLCGFYELTWRYILTLLQMWKGLIPAPFAKGLQVHTPHSYTNYERNLDNFATFTPHHHGLWYHLMGI